MLPRASLFAWEPGGEEALAALPEHLQEGIRNYLEHGLRPGHFLGAVICNDPAKAAEHADHVSSQQLVDVVKFFIAFAPGTSHGSKEKLEAWLAVRGPEAYERNVQAVQDANKSPPYERETGDLR